METVTLSAYDNDTARLNLFSQTDATSAFSTGVVRHVLLAGVEAGRQSTDNFRNTGYFGGSATTVTVPFADSDLVPAATFRQGATDADNHVRTAVGAAYVQDQAYISVIVIVLV
jgi:catecholate siderophore receptor